MYEVRHPFSRERLIVINEDEKLTQDDFGNETDINNIVERFTRTGIMPSGRGPGEYLDCTPLQGDLATAIVESREALEALSELQREMEEKQRQLDDDERLKNALQAREADQDEVPSDS